MQIELKRTTFRRLVQLYWLSLLAIIPLAAWQGLSPGWNDFDAAFTQCLGDTYGYSETPDWLIWVSGAVALAHVAAAIAIYWFRGWSRWLLWVSMLGILILDLTTGQTVTYEPTVQSWIDMLGNAVFGAIVFTSYSQPIAREFSAQMENA